MSSTTEIEYVSAEKTCQQALWMKQALIDYNVRLGNVPIMCDNKGAIDLRKNPVQHSRTRHIKIRHHFLRDNVQKGHISIEKVPSINNIADILTKPFKRESFNYRLTILTREIHTHMKPWVDIISVNTICLGGLRDHVSDCLCHMLYRIENLHSLQSSIFHSQKNRKDSKETKGTFTFWNVFDKIVKHVVSVSPELAFDHYLSHDRAMHPLAPHYERKTLVDLGKKIPRESNASSSSTAQNYLSSSLPLDAK
ncbi:hypothetical protein Tco_1481689 [Tanacetum coccineum]